MPKSMLIRPEEVRKPSVLKINDVSLNQYKPDFKREQKKYGEEKLKQMYRHMLYIREFETALNSIKTKNVYAGVEYNHRGPAHLSMGQESAAVGQAINLNIDDFIFGSHRSHGEILAKCFSAVEQLGEDELYSVMKNFLDGETLAVVEADYKGSVKELAMRFVLYGTLSEIFAKRTGFNRGLGGSMHTFFTPFGSMPNNAIVGGSADISVGSALFKRINRKPGIVLANIGDASMGCGPVWEAMMLSAMDQYRSLWPDDVGGAPPVIFNFINNFYGMGGQTYGETMGFKVLARAGAGVNKDMMHAERVDGYNPLAVADAIARKKKILAEGRGPVLLDTITYRISGHSPSDASSYRTKEEIQLWQEADALESVSDRLIEAGVIDKSALGAMQEKVIGKIEQALRLAIDIDLSPRASGEFIETVMYSNTPADRMEDREPEVLMPLEENPRVKQ